MSQELLQDNLRVFVVPVEILEVEGLSIYEKMAYIVIRSHCNARNNSAFPSYGTIAREGSMSRSSAIRAVESLLQKGLLTKEVRYDVSKNRKIKNTSNNYTLITPQKKKPSTQCPTDTTLVSHRHHPSVPQTLEHNHLTESFNMIDCMSAAAETAAAFDSSFSQSESNEIYQTLAEHVPVNCYIKGIPLGEAYIAEIYLMLLNQFANQLFAEAVRIACELYFDRACLVVSGKGVTMKIDVSNATGFFQARYKDALKLYKLTRRQG